ncbi:MAG: response regulator [Sedimentisphaerales bacterium]|nr:response regulator [Sedimentisphaerales bacterium]
MPDKVLIVDDEPDILRIVSFTLKKWGYEVATAVNGKEGLDVLEDNPDIGLILLDVGMPVMNGQQMLDKLRMHPEWKDIPVIMLTAHSDGSSIKEALSHDVHEYITKPFEPTDLREKIDSVMNRVK